MAKQSEVSKKLAVLLDQRRLIDAQIDVLQGLQRIHQRPAPKARKPKAQPAPVEA
jgi:hypothetical protein